MRLRKGDNIIMLAGKDKGKKGKILRVITKTGMIAVEGINIVKRHQKPTRNFQGGIIEKPQPFLASKAMLVCPRCSEPSRVGITMTEKKRVRVCKKCEEIIDKA